MRICSLSFCYAFNLNVLMECVFFNCRFEVTRRIRLMESKAKEAVVRESGGKENARKDEWHVPILAMTADVIHATCDKCQASGMDGYVSKPFEEENLYQAVSKCFDLKAITDS